MRRPSLFPFLAEPLALLLLITTGPRLHALSQTHPRANQQKSESSDTEVARLSSQLKSSSEEERREAVMQLSSLKSDAAGGALASMINDPSARVRAAVVTALARRGNASAIPLLSARLKQDKDSFVRKTTAYALAEFRGDERTLALTEALKDKDAEVKAAAATSLGDHPDRDAIAALSAALSDKNEFVRSQSARALGVNGRSAVQAVSSLIALLSRDKDSEVKRQAALALGQIGDRAALPALERARHDKDPYLVQAAAEAIKLIEKQS
jgi:HEAT repeat protein